MRRSDLIRHLRQHGVEFVREGGRHTIYWNPATHRAAGVPRHREIKESTARAICAELGIPFLCRDDAAR